jgi:hypothetical protein
MPTDLLVAYDRRERGKYRIGEFIGPFGSIMNAPDNVQTIGSAISSIMDKGITCNVSTR